jgi:hypothetical protein
LTAEELETLYFSSTNDANEGGLGSWRRGQTRRPAETLQKFNASFVSQQNNTVTFMTHKLNTDEDQVYLMRSARQRDASGSQKKLKLAQIEADQEKVAENVRKEAKRDERRDIRASILLDTSKQLVLVGADIDRLGNEELNKQLDYHRELEKLVSKSSQAAQVPLKTHMKLKADRVLELKKALTRYQLRGNDNLTLMHTLASNLGRAEGGQTMGDEDIQYQSDYNDDLT